jgi:Family of unknown function (DUF5706)
MIDKSHVGIDKPPAQTPDRPQGGDHFAMAERIYFAALALQNVQELNARADSKAYLVLTANGFLIAFLGVSAPNIGKIWREGLSVGAGLLALATIALILSVATSLMHAFRIISPRLRHSDDNKESANDHKPVHQAELLFFVDIIRAHRNDREYSQSLLHAPPEQLLDNLGSSIYGASISAQEKYREAQLSIRALGPVLVAWVIFVLLTFALS